MTAILSKGGGGGGGELNHVDGYQLNTYTSRHCKG